MCVCTGVHGEVDVPVHVLESVYQVPIYGLGDIRIWLNRGVVLDTYSDQVPQCPEGTLRKAQCVRSKRAAFVVSGTTCDSFPDIAGEYLKRTMLNSSLWWGEAQRKATEGEGGQGPLP